MVQGKHAGGAGRYWAAGAVAGGLLLAVSAGGFWLTERGDEPLRAAPAVTPPVTAPAPTSPSTPSPSTPSPSTTAPSTTARAVPAALRDCAQAVAAAERVVAEAETGAGHWRRHVQAYRDVVDGRIPYAAADREWRVTREAGPADVRRFTQAERAHEASAADCEGATQGAGDELSTVAQACVERTEAAARAMTDGRRVMGAWEEHLHHMAAQRSHKLSDGQARVLFRQAAREAPGQLSAFAQTREELEKTPACELPGT